MLVPYAVRHETGPPAAEVVRAGDDDHTLVPAVEEEARLAGVEAAGDRRCEHVEPSAVVVGEGVRVRRATGLDEAGCVLGGASPVDAAVLVGGSAGECFEVPRGLLEHSGRARLEMVVDPAEQGGEYLAFPLAAAVFGCAVGAAAAPGRPSIVRSVFARALKT
ncbi:hypothetical protein AAH978_07790 [Streptomyces sp. ZYX-F-203]